MNPRSLESADPSKFAPIPESVESVAAAVVDAAIRIHRTLGPGLLESAYEACLCYELSRRGLGFELHKPLPVVYESVRLDAGFRLDLFVDDQVVVELKTVEAILPVHEAQLLTYLRLADRRLRLLLNFNVALIKDGIRRLVR